MPWVTLLLNPASDKGVLVLKRDGEEKEHILPPEAVVQMQMVEGHRDERVAHVKPKEPIQDMSVGWYATPSQDDTDL